MENQELDILILRYLNGDMNAEEVSAFESRMSTDQALKQSVADYKNIEAGVKNYAKKQMKADLMKAQTAVIGANGLENYKPSINGSSGFNFFSFIAKILVIGSIVSAALIYFGKMPIEHDLIKKANEKMHSFDTIFEVKYDTVWTTIPQTGNLKVGDTIRIETQKKMETFESGNEYE